MGFVRLVWKARRELVGPARRLELQHAQICPAAVKDLDLSALRPRLLCQIHLIPYQRASRELPGLYHLMLMILSGHRLIVALRSRK